MDDRRVAVVVEDDDDIRGLMAALLRQSGFEVHEAATGADGVRTVEERDPVLVTVDLGLPDIDGYEVTRRVRRFTDAYVVILTARNDEIDTLMGLEAGADDYLTKPFRPRELRARIEAMLRRPRGGARAAGPVARNGDASGPALARPGAGPAHVDTAPDGPSMDAAEEGEVHLELDGLVLYPEVHQVTAEGRDVPVTRTEFLILETLLRSGRVVRSKSELFRICRGEDPDSGTFVSESDERTVEVHVGNLRRKLSEDHRRPRWVQTVRGVGYRAAGSARVRR